MRVLLRSTAALALLAAACQAAPDPRMPAEKLDAELRKEGAFHPIFVRMADQLFPHGGDYEDFCRNHATSRRRELRPRLIATLREKSEKAWRDVGPRVRRLVDAGHAKSVTRYWVVNGFAAEADAKACVELAADPAVAFVYLQRGPKELDLHGVPEAGPAPTEAQAKVLAATLKEVETPEPPFSPKDLEIPWNLQDLGVPAAWNEEKVAGEGVVVALTDSGLLTAPPLTRALWRNSGEVLNGKDDDGNGIVDDLFGADMRLRNGFPLGDPGVPHGSACAGIIAGRPTAEKPLVTGVAPRARIMVLRGMGYLKGYEYALEKGADVMSMSFMWVNMELGHYRGLYRTAHEHMTAAGLLALGGAGNFQKNAPPGKQITLPKDIPCVIAAAGIARDGSQPGFSSRGPCTWTGVAFYDDYPEKAPLGKPDVCTFNTGFPCWSSTRFAEKRKMQAVWTSEEGGYGLYLGLQGNSFAGPHVAGVAALMFSANPDLNAWEVKEILEATAKDLGAPGRDPEYGAGLVRTLEAVKAAKQRTR